MSIRKVIVGLLFILVAVALVLLMPRDLDWALGENYDVSKIQDIQVRLDPVDGGESLSCTLNKVAVSGSCSREVCINLCIFFIL